METKARKNRVAKTKRRGEKTRREKETRRKRTEKIRKKEEKTKKSRMIEVKKVAEKWKIWNEEEEAKKLVSEQFHR